MSRSRSWQKSLGLRVEIKKLLLLTKQQSDKIERNRAFSDQENCLRLVIVALIGHFQSYIADLLNELCDLLEPPRDCRRPFGLSYAAMGTSSSMA